MEFVPRLTVQRPQSWNSGFTFLSKIWPNPGFLMLPPTTSRLPCNGCVLFEVCFIYHAHWVNNRKNLLTIAAPLWEDKFCSHCKLFSVAFLFALFRNAEDKHCRVQSGGWEATGPNLKVLEAEFRRCQASVQSSGLWPGLLEAATHIELSGNWTRALVQLALSISFCTDVQAGCLFHWILSIWGVICVWLLLAKFSQIDLYGASNYLLGSPMPKKKFCWGRMFFALGRKIKKNQPPVAAVPLRAGFLPPDYPVVLKVAVHTAQRRV